MKKIQLIQLFCFLLFTSFAQAQYNFDPSTEHPFGLPNPDAPKEILDWAPLIGECDCKSIAMNPDQTWGDTINMVWRFKYIMNGYGVQDETLKEDGAHSGSIRQYIVDSSNWYVHYYSSAAPTATLPAWEGGRQENGDIILYNDQKAPNGMEGWYKISFTNIDEQGFHWLGEWVNKAETFSLPTWKIYCKKRSGSTDEAAQRKIILDNAKAFSQKLIDYELDAIVDAYTKDAKIFPGNAEILTGHEAIRKYWTRGGGAKTIHHELQPVEIKIIGDLAYDFGYYEGKTKYTDGKVNAWKGKYVVVWKKVGSDWKMYLDIWNRVKI